MCFNFTYVSVSPALCVYMCYHMRDWCAQRPEEGVRTKL